MLEDNRWPARVNNFHQKAVLFLVTGVGVGYIPRLPGTLGTMIAIPFSLALNCIALGDFPLAPPRLSAFLCSFAFFRFFDISKVSPANRLEQLPGGAGIVLDDVMAGLYTLVSLRLLLKMGWA